MEKLFSRDFSTTCNISLAGLDAESPTPGTKNITLWGRATLRFRLRNRVLLLDGTNYFGTEAFSTWGGERRIHEYLGTNYFCFEYSVKRKRVGSIKSDFEGILLLPEDLWNREIRRTISLRLHYVHRGTRHFGHGDVLMQIRRPDYLSTTA